MTGLWRLSPDGVELSLFNRQDMNITLAVGKEAIHASLGNLGAVTLLPTEKKQATFTITGLMEKNGNLATLTDAASGRVFSLKPDSVGADGKFATVEVEIGVEGAKAGKVLAHSGSVPRFYERPENQTGADLFIKRIAGHYWRLPPFKGASKTAINFSVPKDIKGQLAGSFEISGPDLRLEGNYTLDNDKLTLKASRANLRNLEIIGAAELGKIMLAKFVWQLSPAGLELKGLHTLLLSGAEN